MYTDADFCNYIQQAAGEQLLSAKAFAYCFIAADEEERQKRLDFLQAAACGDPHPADSSMPGKGLDPALFGRPTPKALPTAPCRAACGSRQRCCGCGSCPGCAM